LGRIALVDAFLDASGIGGGTVVIRGDRLLVDQAFVFADTRGAMDGIRIGVDINVAGEVAITNGSSITTDALDAGHAGDIRMTQAFARAGELLRDRCGERVRGGTVSRFVLGGRDGVPLEPGSLLLSPLVRAEQPAPVRLIDTVKGQREVSFGPVQGLEG